MLSALFLLVLPVEPASAVEFLPESSAVAEWRKQVSGSLDAPCPVSLSVTGAHAFDDHTLLIYGDAAGGPGAYRSFSLRTEDGGSRWVEVLSPAPASSVLSVSFHSAESGHALVGWVVEGPGELHLFRTDDGGSQWERVSEVPKPHGLDALHDFACTDSARCRVVLECLSRGEGAGHAVATSDGGRTWTSRVARLPRSDGESGPIEAMASDGTMWRVRESSDRKELIVRTRPPGRDEWTRGFSIPLDYRFGAGGVLVPCRVPEQSPGPSF